VFAHQLLKIHYSCNILGVIVSEEINIIIKPTSHALQYIQDRHKILLCTETCRRRFCTFVAYLFCSECEVGFI